MKKRFAVFVRLKQGVLDVQGKAIEHSLGDLGFTGVAGVRVGKLIELEVDSAATGGREAIEAMCRDLLANPVIEDFEIQESNPMGGYPFSK